MRQASRRRCLLQARTPALSCDVAAEGVITKPPEAHRAIPACTVHVTLLTLRHGREDDVAPAAQPMIGDLRGSIISNVDSTGAFSDVFETGSPPA
jgi:hypothetical protein